MTSSTTGGAESSTGEGGSTTGIADCQPLIVEALYDALGESDDRLQWVKLYNPCDEAFDLTQYSLGYGGPNYHEDRRELMFSVSPGGCYVVGGDLSNAANGFPDFQYEDDFAPGLDLAAAGVGGGIALFDVPFGMIAADSVPIDAVVYGPNNDGMLIDENGDVVAAPYVGNHVPGGSIRRTDEGNNWEAIDEPTPNVCPPF